MYQINPNEVKILRGRTGAGVMECKRALTEASGDMEKAVGYLREKGHNDTEKRAGRIAAEGLVSAYVSEGRMTGALAEVNCETDFAALNTDFQRFVQEITELVANEGPTDVSALLELQMADGHTVAESIDRMTRTFGEKIQIRRFVRYDISEVGAIHSYIHSDYLTKGKEGVLLECGFDEASSLADPVFVTLMNELSLQISACKPLYIRRDDIPADAAEQVKAIATAQALNEGKTRALAEKIAAGKLKKYYSEVCLLEQPYIRDDSKTVAEMLREACKDDAGFIIRRFTRYEKGA